MLLENKNILIAVSGSIAIYKSLELIRLYIKAGANVKVVMSEGAKKFITPLSFEAISQNQVLHEGSENWDKSQDYNHIDIGKWADVLVLAPATANSINKIANGFADDLLSQTILACSKTKIIAPAANTNMLKNPITQESIKKLIGLGFEVVGSQVKELICKDVGDGAMADPEDIFYLTARELLRDEYWSNRMVVLTGGGTVEKIDDVRYISNFSSGKMAVSLALSLYLKGADVCLISSRGHEKLPKGVHIIEAKSSAQMYEHLIDEVMIAQKEQLIKGSSTNPEAILVDKKPYLFMVAAISDYLPKETHNGKLKKDLIGSSWNLELKQNMDILGSLDKSGIISVGFKAEMDETVAFENASNMLESKSLSAVCLNVLDDKNSFGTDENSIELIYKDESFRFSGEKTDISIKILDNLKDKFKENE